MRRLSLFVPLALAACSADNISPDLADGAAAADTAAPSVRVVDGTLHFATSEAYFDFGREMVNRDPDERRRWEASHGFTSMLSYAEDVMDDYELRLGEALGRPDIFSVAADSTVDLEVPLTLAVLADKEGYFYIGDAICKVDNSGMAQVEGGDKAQAEAALRSGAVPEGAVGSVRPLRASGGLKSVGGEKRIKKLSGSDYKGKRRLDYSVEVYMNTDGKTPIQQAVIVIDQMAKSWKRRFGCWRQHHCDINFISLSATVSHPYLTNRYAGLTEERHASQLWGPNRVNHYSSQVVKELYRGRYRGQNIEIADVQPYFIYVGGGATATGDKRQMRSVRAEDLFNEEKKK